MAFWNKMFSSKQTSDLDKALQTGRVKVGSNFQLSCRFFFTGPGRLEIGNNVQVKPSIWDKHRHVTFSTYHAESIIKIGDNTVLEGTRMGCRILLDIGPDCSLGETSIMDTDFHSLDYLDRNSPDKVKASAVKLESGVRVGYGCHILRGVTIGKETVVRPLSMTGARAYELNASQCAHRAGLNR